FATPFPCSDRSGAAVRRLRARTGKAKLPEVVHVTVEKLVPVDAKLIKPCPATRAASRTVEAVVTAYNANITALEDCDGRMSEIRALGR
ncbi:Rz1-like lysis system protein LysC, partial [Pseudomonas viridiflava]|uniref:Rz1-like lysis system protein LysC n=1 Tax=Pseudomonas viridiflava TaxID=33069 RepID=UPI00197FDED9